MRKFFSGRVALSKLELLLLMLGVFLVGAGITWDTMAWVNMQRYRASVAPIIVASKDLRCL